MDGPGVGHASIQVLRVRVPVITLSVVGQEPKRTKQDHAPVEDPVFTRAVGGQEANSFKQDHAPVEDPVITRAVGGHEPDSTTQDHAPVEDLANEVDKDPAEVKYKKKYAEGDSAKTKNISPADEDGGEASQIESTSFEVLHEVRGGHAQARCTT